jgi:uncharacterized lipoprotein (TIGR02269 family)
MTKLARVLPLLSALLLGACAASSPGPGAWDKTERCEHADTEQCVVVACEGGDCGLFDCTDLDAQALASVEHEVKLAQGYSRPPYRAPAFRNWRNTGLRPGARPRMVFHFRYRQGFLPALPREPGKLVHHHLFPQQELLARWFKRSGVDIHKFTMLIPEHVHRQIHGGTGRGGMWNQAWRDFMNANLQRQVTPEELHRKAVELIFRFELTGPVVPHNTAVGPYQTAPQLLAP